MHLRIMFHMGLSASARALPFFIRAASFLPCTVLLCHPLASLFLIEIGQWNNKIIFQHTSKWWFETGPPEVSFQQMKHHFNAVHIWTFPKWRSLSKQAAKGLEQRPSSTLDHVYLSWVPLGCWTSHTFGLISRRDEHLPLALKGSYGWPMPQKVKTIVYVFNCGLTP